MSRGRSDSPWPSRSSVITRLPRSASAWASGACIVRGKQQPGEKQERARPLAELLVHQPPALMLELAFRPAPMGAGQDNRPTRVFPAFQSAIWRRWTTPFDDPQSGR